MREIHEERRIEGIKTSYNELKLEKGQRRGEKNGFSEEKGLGSRAKGEVSKCLSKKKIRLTFEYI